jgi:predicted nucleotidyltransferase
MERGEDFRKFTGVDGTNSEIAVANEIIRIVDGSKLYGTSLGSGGDVDEMGVFIEPPEYVIGFHNMDQLKHRDQPEGVKSQDGDLDLNIYSLRKYLSLAIQGNPSILMLLFARDENVLFSTFEGEQLQDLASLIVSKRAYPRFRGYLQAQTKRLTGEKRGHTPSRPELIAKHGYDTKFAMHAMRLGYQGIELMNTGRLELPIPEIPGELLVAVRNGEYSYNEVLAHLYKLDELLEAAAEKSGLRDEPALDLLEKWVVETHRTHWSNNVY